MPEGDAQRNLNDTIDRIGRRDFYDDIKRELKYKLCQLKEREHLRRKTRSVNMEAKHSVWGRRWDDRRQEQIGGKTM